MPVEWVALKVPLICFSPEADLAAGSLVTVIGVDAIRHVSLPRQIPLAVMPLLLAAHEVDESFVWWGLRGQVAWSVGHAAVLAYLAFAFTLPILAPVMMMSIETNRTRRRALGALLAVGAVVSAILLVSLFNGPVTAAIEGHHIAYATNIPDGPLIAALYVFATCGSLLLSSDGRIVIFGTANIAAVIVLAWATVSGLTSLWCAWAAIASIAIAIYLRAVAGGDPAWSKFPMPWRTQPAG